MKYKTRIRYETLGELRFLTFSCYHHLPLFNNDAIKDEFVQALDDARKRTNYRIIAWVIMPNHVHALVEMIEGWGMESIVHSWKSYTSNQANRMLRRRGVFWQREYFDRFIRDERHLRRALHYLDFNPVMAGLCSTPRDWRHGSARRHWSGKL